MLLSSQQKGKSSMTTILSRVINRDSRKLKFDESSEEEDEATHIDPQDIYAIRKERDFRSVPGMDGMFYKVGIVIRTSTTSSRSETSRVYMCVGAFFLNVFCGLRNVRKWGSSSA